MRTSFPDGLSDEKDTGPHTWIGDGTPERSLSIPIVDAFIHHTWASAHELGPYIPSAWREFIVGESGRGVESVAIRVANGLALPLSPYNSPFGNKLAVNGPRDQTAPSASLEVLREEVLDPAGITRAVLGFDQGMTIALHPNPYLGEALIRAANDWSIDQWLSGQDDRLYGLALVNNQLPEYAVSEIRRVGHHPRIVGVLMGGNALGKAFGHPIFHPIYKAAEDFGLPVVFHAGTEAPPDTLAEPVAGGPASTYAEFHVLADHAIVTQLTSLLLQGVFEKFPSLRVLVVGAGITWLPYAIWRIDAEYKALRRHVPWLRKRPSEYLRERVRIATYPINEVPDATALARVLGAFPGFEQLLCYASGFPDWDAEAPDFTASLLPRESWASVFHDSARDLYRWPASDSNATRTAQEPDRDKKASVTRGPGGGA